MSFLDRIQTSNVPGRLFLFFLSLQTGALTNSPNTFTGIIFRGVEPIGPIVMVAAILGMLDTIINDVLPPRFHFLGALQTRHFTLMACAAFFAIGAWLCLRHPEAHQLISYYIGCCLAVTAHAFFDIRRRFKWK